jgi:hypothetical protein
MKHAGIAKTLIGCILLVVMGNVGCQQREAPVSGTTPQNPEATRPAKLADTATTAKKEPNEADFPGPPANVLSARSPSSGSPTNLRQLAGADPSVGEPPSATAPEAGGKDDPPLVPLVDHLDQLQRLQRTSPIWFDKQERQVVLVGQICQNRAPLELFACQRGSKEHESIVSIAVQPYLVHAGLLAAHAVPGNPVQYQPEFVPARGTEIEVTIVWQDEQGQRHQARAQDWIRHPQTGKTMEYPWVFAGSVFSTDERGQQYYHADGEGDLICVSNFPSAVLDVPVQSSDSNDALMFEAFTDRIPPLGTPVTLLLKPKLEGKPEQKAPTASGTVHPNEF